MILLLVTDSLYFISDTVMQNIKTVSTAKKISLLTFKEKLPIVFFKYSKE